MLRGVLALAALAIAAPTAAQIDRRGPAAPTGDDPGHARFEKLQEGPVFLGGKPPEIGFIGLDGNEHKRGDTWFYGAFALVQVASGDRDGEAVIYRAPGQGRWRDAIAEWTGIGSTELVDLLLPVSKDTEPFPPVKMRYSYRLSWETPESFFVFNRPVIGSRSAKGVIKQSLNRDGNDNSAGLPAGPNKIILTGCVDLAPHPLGSGYTVFYWFDKLFAAKQLFTDLLERVFFWTTVTAEATGGLDEPAVLAALGQKLGQAITDQRDCSDMRYTVTVPALIPKVHGLKPSEAKKRIEDRGLEVTPVAVKCDAARLKQLGIASGRVFETTPARSQYLDKRVTMRYCAFQTPAGSRCPEASALKPCLRPTIPKLAGNWQDNLGNTYAVTQSGSKIHWVGRSRPRGSFTQPGQEWTHVFDGDIKGKLLVGDFRDTAGNLNNKGHFEFRIVSAKRLELVVAKSFRTASTVLTKATPTAVVEPATPWEGDWSIHVLEDDGDSFQLGRLTFVQSGNTVCGVWDFNSFPDGRLGNGSGGLSGGVLTLEARDGFGPATWMDLKLSPDGAAWKGRYTVTQSSTGIVITGAIDGTRLGAPTRKVSCP